MDTEPLDLEEGEVVDDEQTDVFGTYNILQRPQNIVTSEKMVNSNHTDDSDESPEPGDSSDSDLDTKKVKRPKLKATRRKTPTNSDPNSRKYKIWCTQVQEEALSEDLVSCGVTRKMYQGRNVENYDLPKDFNLNGYNSINNSSDEERDVEVRTSNKRTNSDRKNIKLRLGKRQSSMDVDSQKGSGRTMSDLSISTESSDTEVANDITDKLGEKKDELIKRVVEIMGKEKAIEFYKRTKEIEEEGGMMIMNGSRRRTPGGVYLYLVKNDEHMPQTKIREIFLIDKKECTKRKGEVANSQRQNATDLLRNLVKNGSEKDLPTLLTRAELSTRQIAEVARLRRGEGMERNPVDSDRTVSNPPPSPATDDPDHSEHVTAQRRIEDYSDDFLDLGADIDTMEMF